MPNFTGSTVTSFLQLLTNATNWSNIATSTGASNLYVSLHNADPGATGTQATSETAYTNYARLAVVRTTSGFTVGGSAPTVNFTNASSITFAQCGASGDILTHWGLGLSSSGAGTLILSAPIGPGPGFDFTCTLASPGVLTVPILSTSLNARVSVYAAAFSTLPTGITEGIVYYVGTIPGTNQITLSTNAGNANPVNTSAAGMGYLIVQNPLSVTNGVTPSFAAGQLIYYMS
jgi:hypothetical protein